MAMLRDAAVYMYVCISYSIVMPCIKITLCRPIPNEIRHGYMYNYKFQQETDMTPGIFKGKL